MDKETRANEYVSILESLQRIRNGIVQDNAEVLSMTGYMPESAQKELGILLDITASVFVGFSELGLSLEDKGNFVAVTIAGKEFLCPKEKLGTKQVTLREETKTEVATQNIAADPVEVEVKAEETPAASDENVAEIGEIIPEAAPETDEASPLSSDEEDDVFSSETESEDDSKSDDLVDSLMKDFYKNVDNLDDNAKENPGEAENPSSENGEEDSESKDAILETSDDSQSLLDMVNRPVYEAPVEEKKEETYEETIEVKDEPVSSAKIIGGAPVAVKKREIEFFDDENKKAASEMIYTYSKMSVKHLDVMGGGRPEEMLVMIAPLKISKYECSSVPIIVTIVHNGKQKTCSSFDTLEKGKNIVLIDIDEFYFLCRGSFDRDGNFKAMIVTTGLSAQQGDQITILSSKTYGNSLNPGTKNGHIKFRYDADAGDGVIEVFPFGHPGDDDFVALVRNKEFADYYLISKILKTQSKAMVFSKGDISNELVCHWDGDLLEVELV